MRIIFADTAYWVALLNPRDASHRRAAELSRSLHSARLVTTEEVLGEVLTYFAGFGAYMRGMAADLVASMMADPDVQIQEQSHHTFSAGLGLYRQRPDKEYSLVDCVTMTTMRGLGLYEVLTTDQHFVQEGFVALMLV